MVKYEKKFSDIQATHTYPLYDKWDDLMNLFGKKVSFTREKIYVAGNSCKDCWIMKFLDDIGVYSIIDDTIQVSNEINLLIQVKSSLINLV